MATVEPLPPCRPEPPLTRHVEEHAVVAEGGAGVEARVGRLHRLDLQLRAVEPRVLVVGERRLVLGPVDGGLEGVLGGAVQVQAVPGEQGEELGRELRGGAWGRGAVGVRRNGPKLAELRGWETTVLGSLRTQDILRGKTLIRNKSKKSNLSFHDYRNSTLLKKV